MVVYIEMDGNVKILSPENLYQGSTTNRVTLITPFPSTTAVSIGFILPDGTTVTDESKANYFPMSLISTETASGITSTAYDYALPFTVLEQYGDLKIAFKATFSNGNQTSYLATVEVQESILPELPTEPTPDVYQLLLEYIQKASADAESAVETAEAAQTAAENATNTANTAKSNSETAISTANAAKSAADTAESNSEQAVTTANNAAATAAAANQTAIEAKNQASAAQTAAAQAQEDADAAAKSAEAAENSASEAADSAEEAVTTAQGAVSTANEAKTTADGIDGKATQALSNSEQAVTTANEAKELAEQAVAGAGTEVYVDNALQARLDFTSDPQTQINDKQTQIDNIESGTTKVGSAAQADKLSTARNLKVDLSSGNAQPFDGSANAEDIGVDGVLPAANGGTGASDLDSVKVGEAGSADEATKLATARNMQVNLASGNQQSFDGSADATEIGVKGILPVGNGGTGATSLANITVGRATADGSGNNISDTYAKLSQVVRVDEAQQLTDTQKMNFSKNSRLRLRKIIERSSQWKTVAHIGGYGQVCMAIATDLPGQGQLIDKFFLAIGYMETVNITQIGYATTSPISAIRLRSTTNAQTYIDLLFNENTSFATTVSVYFEANLNDNFGETNIELIDFENFSGDESDYTITTLNLNNSGINTTGAIYQQGSPVLVGFDSPKLSGTSGTVKLPSKGWYCINYKSTSLVQWYSTGVFYWGGDYTYLPISAYMLSTASIFKRAVNIVSDGTVNVFDPDSGTRYTDFTVEIYELA